MKVCLRCHGARWICEVHPKLPWGGGASACACGAPGCPCPFCNRTEGDAVPEMPNGFRAKAVCAIEPAAEPDPELEAALARLGRKRPLH